MSKNKIQLKNIFKKGPAQHRTCSSAGFVLLYAMMLSSIIFAVALGVTNITMKELNFATSAKSTNEAFLAADTGIECALFWDKTDPTLNAYIISGNVGSLSDYVFCGDNNITIYRDSWDGNIGIWHFYLPYIGASEFACAKVTVTKDIGDDTASFVSRGYNVTEDYYCNYSGDGQVERKIEANYQ
jgi:hypothetical protein